MKLPQAIRFFRKPDHIAFLGGLVFIILSNFLFTFETKLISTIFFSFTIIYEAYEISKGNRQIFKVDHIAFMIGYAMLIISFWENSRCRCSEGKEPHKSGSKIRFKIRRKVFI